MSDESQTHATEPEEKDILMRFLMAPVQGYLFLKFPLGIFSFVMTVILLSISLGFILAPLAYWFGDIYIPFWEIDTFGETLILSALGVLFLLVSMHLLNGLALIWREVAEVMLGSRKFEMPADPGAELLTTA
jgi:hypothetical protein